MSVIDDPAAAVAAGLCLTARSLGEHTARHPRRCDWCGYPVAELGRMVRGYVDWARPDARTGAYGEHEARRFQSLPRHEQLALVAAAQGVDGIAPVGGVESSRPMPQIGPHQSRPSTDSGSKLSADPPPAGPMQSRSPDATDAEDVPWL